MSEAGPRVNGPASPTGKYIDGIDPDDPQYIKNLQRPAEVKEDLQQMENRSRVSVILNSQAFKDELEQVVEEQLRNGPYPASLIALQQITDLLLPQSRGSLGSLARASSVIPINDLRGVESFSFVKGEKLLRCKVASLYRLVDLCGWSHGIHNHISARVSPETENFLLNPFGLTYSEITASSLVKVDVNGDIVEPGSTQLGVYRAGFSVHSAIHQARPDIKCIVHLHTPSAVAVSALKCGLLAMSQEALICGNVSYHDFHGVAVDADERERLARNLGVHNKILILRNRGVLACGESIEEAFHFTFNVMAACEAQVKAMPVGLDNIVIPSVAAREQTHRVANQGGGGVDSTGRKWKIGEMEFEALMRTLDNSGFRTGHVYKMPIVKQEKKERSNSEVEIPPASSSFTYIFDGDYEHSKYVSPVKAAMERQKKAYKAGWLTTPNTYKKTEVAEIGTTTPKKITKWVPDADTPNRPGGAIVKIESPNQFAPQGENPKEFKEKQKSIKKDYYEERITAGPQSRILEGITWDEAQRAKDGQLGVAGDQLIVVGAASKGIIQRDHQHNAVVYRQYYAANPFENMSEAEIDAYQAEVQRRERGELETSIEEEVQPPVVEVPAETPVVQYPPEPEIQEPEVRYTRAYEASQDTPVTSRPRPPQGYTAHKDVMLAQLAEKVVQTVIHDALSVAHQGKGQQTLIGADPLHKHHFLDHLSVGGQITSEHGNITSHCKPIQCVGSCQGHSNDRCSDCHTVRTCANNVNRINHTYSGGQTECTGAVMVCLEAGVSCLHSQHENLLELSTDHVEGGSSCSYTRSITRGRGEMAAGICRGGPHEEFSAAVVLGSCCDYSQTSSCISEQQGSAGCGFECSENPSLHLPVTIRQQPNAQQPPGDMSSSRKDTAINQKCVHSSPNSHSMLPQSKPLHDALKCLPSQACEASVSLKNLQKGGDNMAALTHGGQVACSFHETDLPETVLTTKAGAAMYKNLLVIDEGPYLEYLPRLNVPSEETLFTSPAQGQGTCQAALLNTWPFEDHKLQLKSIDNFMDNTESVTLLAELAHSVDECKKNPIDDVFLLDNMKSSVGGLCKNAFDSCNIIQHVDFMTMSRDNSFCPPEITVYPVSRVGMPPGPAGSNVQRASEVEGRPRYEAFHRSPVTVSRSPGRGGAREDTASKQRWTPKQKSQRQQLDLSLGENVSLISEATRREEKRVLERSFGRQGQLDVDPEQSKFDSLRREDALRKYREEKRAKRNEEARIIYEMRRGDPNFNITDGLKKDMGNNRAYGYNNNDRDNEMSRTESAYRTREDAVRNEANIRKSAYYMRNDRARRNDGVSDEKENTRNQDNKLHEAERRTDLGGRHKYDLSDDNTETFNVESLDAKTSGTPDDSDTDHFSVVSKKTESSEKLIKELKDKIEDRKSRMLEKTWDVGGNKSAVVEKLVDIMDERRRPVPADISVSQLGSVAAPTHLQQPVGGSKDKSDTKGNDHMSVVSDDTVLEKTDDDEHEAHRQDERDRSGGRFRERSGERDRRRGRQGEEESRDRERREGKREAEDDREKSEGKDRKEQRDEEGMDKDRYRGRSGEWERRRGRRDDEEEEIDRDRYRGRSGERERRRGRRDDEEEIDRDRYRGRSGERERRKGRRDDEEEEMDRDRYRGRSGERERRRGRRDDEEEDMDRDRYRGRSGERERRRGRRDDKEEEMDRDRYRGRSGERRRGRRDDEEEEMDRDRYRGRSGERERRRGRRDKEEEDMDRDRYRGRSGERERRRGRRDDEDKEMDRDRYRGRSGEREKRRGRRDNEGDASDRQRGKSAERERRRGRRDYGEDEVSGEETDRRKRRQGYEEDQYTGKNEDKYRQRGRRDGDRVISDDERRRKRDKPLDTSTDDKSVDISIDSKEILKLDDSLKGRAGGQTEATEGTQAAKERQSEHDKSQRRQERTNQQTSEDKSRSSRTPVSRDDLSDGLASTSQAKSGSRQETKGIEPAPSDHTPAHQASVDNVVDSLSKSSQKHGVVSPPLDDTMDRSIRAETDSRFHDSDQRKNEKHTKSERKATQEKDKLKPKEQKLDDSADSVKGLVLSSKISADASQAVSKHSRKSADSSSHASGHRPSQTGPISAQTVVNIKPLVKEPVERFQSTDLSADLQQASQKASAMIATDLDEGFDSVPHLPVKKDMKTDISLQGKDRNKTHEDKKTQQPVSDYETAFITPETVKTDLGVLKASADKISAGYNKYTKDIGRDRQERKPGSTGGRHRYKDLEIPEISLTKDNIVDKQRFPEKEIPEISLTKDNIVDKQRFTDREIPEISTKGNIHAKQTFTEKEIPEMMPLKDKNMQRYIDREIPEMSLTEGKDDIYGHVEIPEMSLTRGKTERGHGYRNVEIPETMPIVDKAKDRQKHTKKEIPETMPIVDKAKDRQKHTKKEIPETMPIVDKAKDRQKHTKKEIPETMPLVDKAKDRQKHTKIEIPEIQGAKQATKEPAERFLSMDKKIDIPQEISALIVTDLDGDVDSVHHFPGKDKEAVINLHGLDKKRTHEDKKTQKPVGDYETAFITPETVKTDLGVLKTSADKISAGYNKYTKDIGRDRQERKPASTGGRHRYKDLEIPEISLTKDNIVDKQRFTDREIPEMLPLKGTNRQRYIDEDIPEMSFTNDKTERGHRYGDVEIPETMSVVDKTTDRLRYTNKEIPEIQFATPPLKEPMERFQSKVNKDDLQQAYQKASALIVTDLDEGFGSVPHLQVKKDIKANIGVQGTDRNKTHEKKTQKPVSDYETAFITPETVKTDLGVLKTSADKISAGYNKYTKDIGRDRQERKPGSTGGRHRYKDLEIPEISSEKEIPEISLTKDNIVDKQRFTDREIPEMLPLKGTNRQRYIDEDIPEMSFTNDKTERGHRYGDVEIPETMSVVDKTTDRLRYTNKEIPEIQFATPPLKEPMERFQSKVNEDDLQQAYQKASALIVTDLDEGFGSVPHLQVKKDIKANIGVQGTDRNKTHEKKTQKPVSDYETAFITPETVKTDLGVLKTSADKISAGYNKYTKDIGRDRQERKPGSTGGRHRYKDLEIPEISSEKEIPEISLTKDNIVDKQRFTDRAIPEMLPLKGTNRQRYIDEDIPEMSFTKDKTERGHRYGDVEIPETMSVVDKTTDRLRYTNKEIPEIQFATQPLKEPVERFQSKVNRGGDLQQAYQKASDLIVTDLDEGFDSVPHLPFKKDMKTDISLQGKDRNRTHEDKKTQKSVSDYETAFITPETVKTDLGVLKTSADKISAGYNKYTKDIGRDRQERKPGSTGGRHRYKDLEIPEISLTKDNIVDKQRFPEKEIPEILPLKDKNESRQKHRDKEIPEISVKQATAVKGQRLQFPESPSAKVKGLAVEVLKSPVIAHISGRAPRAVPEDDDDEKVCAAKIQETDIDQEVEAEQRKKTALVGMKKTSGLEDTTATSGVDHEAAVTTDTHKPAFDPEVYKEIKARSLAYKENPTKFHASKAKVSPDTNTVATKSYVDKDDRGRPSIYKENILDSDKNVDSKTSDIYTEGYRDNRTRLDNYKDRAETTGSTEGRGQYDTYTENDPLPVQDIAKPDARSEGRYKSDAYKDSRGRSDALKVGRDTGNAHKDDGHQLDAYKDTRTLYDKAREDMGKRVINTGDEVKSGTTKQEVKSGITKQEVKSDTKSRLGGDKGGSNQSKEGGHRLDINGGDLIRATMNAVEMSDLQATVPTVHRGDVDRLLNEKVIKDADNKIQKRIQSEVNELRNKLPEESNHRLVSETSLPTDKTAPTSQHIKSPGVKVSQAADVSTAPATVDLTRPATVGLTKPATVDLTRPATVDLTRPATVDLTRSATVGLTKPATVDLTRPATVGLTKPATVDLTRPATVGLTKPATVGLTKPATVDLTRPTTVGMTKPATVGLTKPATVGITKPATVEITKPATVEITKPATVGITKPATGEFTRPVEDVMVNLTAGHIPDSNFEDDKTKGGLQVDRTASSKKILADVISKIPESSQQKNRKDDRTKFVKRTGPDYSGDSEDESNEKRKDNTNKGNSGRLSKVANETTSRLGRESGTMYPASRDEEKLSDVSNLRGATVGEKKAVGKRNNWGDRSTDVALDSVLSPREVDKQYPATGDGKVSDVNVQDMPVQGDNRFFKRELSLELAAEAAAKAGNRTSKPVLPDDEPRVSSPEIASVRKDAQDVRKPPTNVRAKSAQRVPGASVRSGREAERSHPDRRNVRSLSPKDVFDDNERQQRTESRTRPPKRDPRANQGRVEAGTAYPDRRNVRSLSPKDVFDDDKRQQLTESRTRPPNLVPRANQARVEAGTAYPDRRNVRSLSPKDVFDDDKKQQHTESRTRPPALVPRANQARVEAGKFPGRRNVRSLSPKDVFDDDKRQQHTESRTRPPIANQARVEAGAAYPGRRKERAASAADISNIDARRSNPDSRTRSSQLSSQPPSNRPWRSASEADVPREDKHVIDDRAKASFPEADDPYSRDTEDQTFDDHELSEAVTRPQEKQKYAGFVKRTGRGGRKSLPLRGVSLEGEDKDIEKTADDRLEEMKTEHTKDDTTKLVSQKDEPSEVIIRDHFSTVVHENPIEVTVDNDDTPPQPSPKKGIMGFFGKVKGKSADFVRMLDRSKKKRPTAYYEEGEKRKIKKLSKEKEKEETKVLYFEKSEEASDSFDSFDDTFDTIRTSDEEFPEAAHESPPAPAPVVEEKPLQGYGSVRYQNRPPPLKPPKPLSTFIDPSEVLDAMGGSASEEDEGSPTGRRKGLSDDDSPRGGQFQTFMSFGKSNIGPSVARPPVSRFGFSRSPDAGSRRNVLDAEVAGDRMEQTTETDQTSMTQVPQPVQGYGAERDGQSEDTFDVQLRSKTDQDPVTRRSNISSRGSVRRSGASQRVSAEARLSDFISNLPPPSFEPDAAAAYDASFPPPPDTSSSSSML